MSPKYKLFLKSLLSEFLYVLLVYFQFSLRILLFTYKMVTTYNLRSSQRKKYISDHSGNKCYLKNYLENRSPETFNPKVCLERLKFLDCSNIHNYRFYIEKDRIIIKQDKSFFSNKKYFFKFCSMIFIALCLIYYKDEVKLHGISIAKNLAQYYPAIQNLHFVKVQKNYLKSLTDKIQNISNDNCVKSQKSKVIQDFITKSKDDDDFEIIKLVTDNFLELKSRNEIKNPIKTSEAFIQTQCKIEIKDNFKTFFDESNITDYALESLGAEIVSTFNTEPYGIKTIKFLNFNIWPTLGKFLIKSSKYFSANGPNSILVPWKKPGDCWAFKGSYGRVLIKLSEKIFITAITVDHIPKKAISDGNIESAPKRFSVIGVEEPGVQMGRKYLGAYEYKSEGAASQTFLVQAKVKIPFSGVEISIESNHGNENYTCVYKIRVHGHK